MHVNALFKLDAFASPVGPRTYFVHLWLQFRSSGRDSHMVGILLYISKLAFPVTGHSIYYPNPEATPTMAASSCVQLHGWSGTQQIHRVFLLRIHAR